MVALLSFLAKRIEVAKLYHFDSAHDRLFRRTARPGGRPTPERVERERIGNG
jgi:hypothetical protein